MNYACQVLSGEVFDPEKYLSDMHSKVSEIVMNYAWQVRQCEGLDRLQHSFPSAPG